MRRIPLFPLPLVLFPGVALPLHIFEPRYQRMLDDCLAGEREFGLVCLIEGMEERELPTGWIGCIAKIEDTATLSDGRSNIIVTGGDRFELRALVEDPAPYLVGDIAPYADDADVGDAARLADLCIEVATLFTRVAGAARVLAEDRAVLPSLPPDAALMSFAIASMIDLDVRARQALLVSRSPTERLEMVERVLGAALAPLEESAAMHERAKGNGKGAH
ncbi:MAG: LON peptidase substrate-binding domain-containing protein [Gemmatimonadaceae bacterium]